MTVPDTIFPPVEMRHARSAVIEDELRMLRMANRRAKSPVMRVALAEFEQQIMTRHQEMLQSGLVNPLPGGLAS